MTSATIDKRLVLLAVLILGATAAILVALTSSNDDDALPSPERIARAADDPRGQFAVFGDPAHGVTAQDREILADFGEIHDVNPNDARAIDVPWSSSPLYVVPGADKLCIASPSPDGAGFGVSCNTTAEAAKGNLIGSLRAPDGTVRVEQFVPNGVDAITVTDSGGKRTVPVHGNVAAFEARGQGTTSFRGPEGARTQEVPGA